MTQRFRYRLTLRQKDELLTEQAALIEAQAAELARLKGRIAALDAQLAKPRKTSKNASISPCRDDKPSTDGKTDSKRRKKPRKSRPGVCRVLTEHPDETIRSVADHCPHCAADVSAQKQRCRHRYDHIEIPPIRPDVTRVELLGGRCAGCGKRFRATPPDAMAPGSPFGPSIQALLLYLHQATMWASNGCRG